RCQFRVMPGPNELVAISPDASSKAPVREAFHVPEGPRFEAAIRVEGPAFAPAVLTGRVAHADGTPAPGVIVHAQMQNQAEIAAQGRIELEFLGPRAVPAADGSYRLTGLSTAPPNVALEEPKRKRVAAAAEG